MSRSRLVLATLVVVAVTAVTGLSWLAARPSGRPGSPTPPGGRPATTAIAAASLTGTVADGGTYEASIEHDPTAGANQAKVWFAAGAWWATILVPARAAAAETPTSPAVAAALELRIGRLDAATGRWIDTGVVVDERPRVHAAVAWDGTTLAVVTAGEKATDAGAARFTSFHLDAAAGRFVIDPDVPVPLTALGVTSPTLARDRDGALWFAALSNGRLVVRHTTGDDRRWSADGGDALQGGADSVRAATLTAIDGRVVLAWNRAGDTLLRLAIQAPGELASWPVSTLDVPGLADAPSPLTVTGVAGTPDPRVLIATELEPIASAAGSLAPAAVVIARAPDGTWSSTQLGRTKDHLRAPALVVDASLGVVVALAATSTGALVMKPSPLDRLAFEAGEGRALTGPDTDGSIRSPSLPSGPLDLASGVVVLAGDDAAGRYVTATIAVRSSSSAGATPSASAGPGASGEPTPPPASAATVLREDRFDVWPARTRPSTWTVTGQSGGRGNATVVGIRSADNRSLQIRTASSAGGVRACRSFPATATGDVTVVELVRVARVGTSDTTIAAVRGPGGDAASLRVTRHAAIASFNGALKHTTPFAVRAGTWYRVRLVVHLGTGTWDWSVATTAGKRVGSASRLPWRTPGLPAVDTVCVQSGSGVGTAVDIDDLVVAR